MYKKRQLLPSLIDALTQFPAILITGPRQSGKTTFLTRELGKKYQYVSFDDPLTRDLIIQAKGKFYPVEIKLTATPMVRHLEPLNKFKALAGEDAATEGMLVCRIRSQTRLPNNNIAMPWHKFSNWLTELLT